ncbi:Tubulin-specific chaperone D-like protein [Cladobotryum mycophilum]|uniref:Tubulin-specific chaperone D-like protein n=1 Tax=Cladobotryum mycophilum TaxID=491253 RepID=A0ABR0T3N0_9HYPO
MDATETDSDVQLYKHSKDLVKDLDHGIATHLRKPDGQGGTRLRPWVRLRDALKDTCSVLDLFQELPQLLDPHLPKWIPFLAETYLEYLQSRHRHKRVHNKANLLAPLDFVICRILYSFCKVRGEKVIVRFLNVETKYLELLLSAVEDAEQQKDTPDTSNSDPWAWEQRYIAILWLSHLLLAPFDLSTISSADLEEGVVPQIPGFKWPANVPGLTMRVIPLAIKYLATPGKEKDAAKALLVRIAMRRDMQEIGILESLVNWSLAFLQPKKDEEPLPSYVYLGVLSFLAGLLRSASETSDLDKYLPLIFDTVLAISASDNEVSKVITSLALARKMMLKVTRSLVVSVLRRPRQDMKSTELTENAIGYLLESLSDNDTPVRLSASKSLSIITLKLDPDMASQVVEAVLESLNRNVLWSKASGKTGAKPVRDLSAVNSLEWHGLTLTLSHLLYRRSPPASQLSDIFHALLLGLSFEQRGVSGASVGSNVRDAACFGIWALARRYTTEELLAVPTTSVFAAKLHASASSILQVLGTELITTASLDPEGNIRRGASAALQELIGRHPDTVDQGIGVVQTVDYHAVARRSRAIQEVAINATTLSHQYGEALVDGILGWRGIGDMDTASRRVAGTAFGVLTAKLSDTSSSEPFSRFEASIDLVMDRLNGLQRRQVEERHGLLSCFAAVVDKFSELSQKANSAANPSLIQKVLNYVSEILQDCKANEYRRPELIAESASRLAVSALPLIQAATFGPGTYQALEHGSELLSSNRLTGYLDIVSAFDSVQERTREVDILISKLRDVIPDWLNRNEPETVESASTAGLMLLILSKQKQRAESLEQWANIVAAKASSLSTSRVDGYFHALAVAQPLAEKNGEHDIVCKAFLDRWNTDKEIETRVALLQSILRSRILKDKPTVFLDLLEDGLNNYTVTARGDEGSLVRVQTLKAIKVLWTDIGASSDEQWVGASVQKLIYSILRLSAEKLDRVRREAKDVVALLLSESHVERFQSLEFTSRAYFMLLLELASSNSLQPHASDIAKGDIVAWIAGLMTGLVSSADTGNEDLIIQSRAALCDFCEASPENLRLVCTVLLHNLKTCQGEDRIIVPTLEIIAFLFHVGIFQRCRDINYRSLCLQTQKAGYKTANVRKVTACVKVYSGIAEAAAAAGEDEAIQAGGKEARKRLGALMLHPWPRVKSAVVDELWSLVGSGDGEGDSHGLTGVDWGAADKSRVSSLVEELRLG